MKNELEVIHSMEADTNTNAGFGSLSLSLFFFSFLLFASPLRHCFCSSSTEQQSLPQHALELNLLNILLLGIYIFIFQVYIS